MLEIPDPGIPGNVFHVDPERTIARCKAIFEKHGLDHRECRHCLELREMVARVLYAQLAFTERAKPWAKPLGGPTDTQPIAIVEEVGFDMG